MSKDFTIAIIGGGIGGLCLAAVISKYDPSRIVNIYEKRPVTEPWPNGIGIWKRTWQVLEEIGMEEELVKRSIPLPKDREVNGPVFRKSDQSTVGYEFHSHIMPYGPSTIPRPLLTEILLAQLSRACTVHNSKKLLRFQTHEAGPIHLFFQDGSTAQADILIGADGVNSVTRATLFRSLADVTEDAALKAEYMSCILPRFSGQLAYRCSASLDKIKAENPDHPSFHFAKIWCGKDQHMLTNLIGENVGVFVVTNKSLTSEDGPYDGRWVVDVAPQEIIDLFTGWEPDVQNLVKHIEKGSRWAMHETRPLPLSVHGRVALLGDAAHAMLPHQGVGGGQAIEDAHILGRLLAHPRVTVKHVPEVLKIYERIRLEPAQLAARRSRENGLMYDFRHPDFLFDSQSSREDLARLGEAIGESFKWLGQRTQGGVMADWVEAHRKLEEILRTH